MKVELKSGETVNVTFVDVDGEIAPAFRREIERGSFGYDVRPKVKCKRCGHTFRHSDAEGDLARARFADEEIGGRDCRVMEVAG